MGNSSQRFYSLSGGGQAIKAMVFGLEGIGDSNLPEPIYVLLDILLLGTEPFLKNDFHCCFISKESKRIELILYTSRKSSFAGL